MLGNCLICGGTLQIDQYVGYQIGRCDACGYEYSSITDLYRLVTMQTTDEFSGLPASERWDAWEAVTPEAREAFRVQYDWEQRSEVVGAQS